MQKITTKNILILIAVIFLTLFILKVNFSADFNNYQQLVPEYAAKKFPLPVLLYSSITPSYLRDNYKYFKHNNISGFIIASLPSNWNSDVDSLPKHKRECRRINGLFAENYLRTSIAEDNLPCWDDETSWVSINAKIRKVARFARRAGFRGILIDTKAYNPMVWNPAYSYEQYNSISDELAEKVIYQRGREIMQIISEEFPHGLVMVTPAGLFGQGTAETPYYAYYNWIHFFNGLLSEAEEIQISLLADNTQDMLEQKQFAELIASANASLKTKIDYPNKWFKRNSLSLTLSPFNRTEKWPRFSTEQFRQQLFLAEKYSGQYVVIVDQTQALWQTDQGEHYGLPIEKAAQPVAPTLPEYLAVLRSLKDPYLQAYFIKVQQKRDISYLGLFLNRLFAILKL